MFYKIKKNEMKIIGYFLAVVLITTLACKKEITVVDTTAPKVEIESPIQNNIYPSLTGDCHVEFTTQDDVELRGIAVNITNTAGASYYSNNLTIFSKSYDFHDHLVVSGITSVTPCTLKIEVTDKSGNTTIKTLPFNLKP
jgi:hypothetical protein